MKRGIKMKRPTELYAILKTFILTVFICICIMALAIGSFKARDNSEYMSGGQKTEVVTIKTIFSSL